MSRAGGKRRATRASRFARAADLDKTRGVVHIKDLYPALRNPAPGGRTAADLLPVVRPLIYVPETARLEKLLPLFSERKLHMAIVVDEYGGTVASSRWKTRSKRSSARSRTSSTRKNPN